MAQDYSGIYTVEGQDTPVKLVIEHQSPSIQGRLSGSEFDYEIQGTEVPNGISGRTLSVGQVFGFFAQLQADGRHLSFNLFEYTGSGQPNLATATTIILTRLEEAPSTPSLQVQATDILEVESGVVINSVALSADQLHTLEQHYQTRISAGHYWYDGRCGAWGMEGGPTLGFIRPGLDLPGPMPAHISGGGTGIFINGREIHRQDQWVLHQMLGVTYAGRYWLDAQGNLGVEGGAVLVNLLFASQQTGGGQGGVYSGMGGTVGVDGSGGVLFYNKTASGGYQSWSN